MIGTHQNHRVRQVIRDPGEIIRPVPLTIETMPPGHVSDDRRLGHPPGLEAKLERLGRNVNVIVCRKDASGLDVRVDEETGVEVSTGRGKKLDGDEPAATTSGGIENVQDQCTRYQAAGRSKLDNHCTRSAGGEPCTSEDPQTTMISLIDGTAPIAILSRLSCKTHGLPNDGIITLDRGRTYQLELHQMTEPTDQTNVKWSSSNPARSRTAA